MRTQIALFYALFHAVLAVASPGDASTASPEAEARHVFEEIVERANNFDASVVDFYSDEARIVTLRNGTDKQEMSGAQWKELVRRVMPVAERIGDTNTYEAVSVTPHGDGFRVTAVRTSALKCVEDPSYHLDLVKADGSWKVVEEYSETVSLSRCKPSEKLAAELETVLGLILPHLPLDLDEDTRLETVEIQDSALIYHQSLHTITADEMDLEELTPLLRGIGLQAVCGHATMTGLLNLGASVRYLYVDRDGVELARIDIGPGMCP